MHLIEWLSYPLKHEAQLQSPLETRLRHSRAYLGSSLNTLGCLAARGGNTPVTLKR